MEWGGVGWDGVGQGVGTTCLCLSTFVPCPGLCGQVAERESRAFFVGGTTERGLVSARSSTTVEFDEE